MTSANTRSNSDIKNRDVKSDEHSESSDSDLKKNTTEVKSFLKTLCIFILLAVFLRASVVEAFKIPSGSMMPTLIIHDHILVTKFNYGFRLPFISNTLLDYRTPKRGDIIVFTLPDDKKTPKKNEARINIIKRVIGLPGDTVEVSNRQVLINNQVHTEDYEVRWLNGGTSDFGPVTVPAGHLFMLGDNRDHSRDSRFWEYPFLDARRVKGKALIIYWNLGSLDRVGKRIR